MKIDSWIRHIRQKLFGRRRSRLETSPTRPVGNRPHNFRPSIETLEDRTVPTTFKPTFVLADGHVGSIGSGQGHLSNPAISGYSPVQIRTAYGINSVSFNGSLGTGAGQTIAIVDAYNDPNIVGDLDTFDQTFSATTSGATLYSQFGAASTFLTVYNQNGQVINPSSTSVPVDNTGGWEMEEALDVEWAHAIAPGAKIVLVEANSSSNDLYTAVHTAAGLPGVSVVSMSWGSSDASNDTSFDSYFTTPAGHQGVTFLASTGDSSVGGYPAFSPNVIAVGGTTLTLNASNGIQSETTWSTGSDSWAPANGTGGGTSSFETEPSYQKGVQSTGYRTIPDVAFDADPATGVAIYDSYDNSPAWVQIGGTSLASPSFAGIMALANEGRTLQGLGTFNSSSNPQQALTALYSMPSSDFHDITSGHITANGKTYNAGPGYDEVSGLGSPVANALVAGLAAYGTSGSPTPTATQLAFTTEPPQTIPAGTPFTTVVQLENSAGGSVSQSGTSVTLALSAGTFSSTGTNILTTTTTSSGQASFSVDVTAGGSYTVTASSTGFANVTSTAFTEAVSASKLAFLSAPSGSVAVGTASAVVVQLESSSGGSVALSGVTVTLAIAPGTFSNQATTMSAVSNGSGQASFSVVVTATGSYSLSATSAGLTGATAAFAVTSSASQLAFSTQPPASVVTGGFFTTVVQLENSSGTAVPQSGVTVTLKLANGSFGAGSTTTVVTNASGQASFSVTVNATGSDSVNASASGFTTVSSHSFNVATGDWFSQNLSDLTLQTMARTDFNRDGAITYADMLGLLTAAAGEATVSTATFQSLQALAAGASTLNMPGYVSSLASKVVNGDPANATFQSLNSQGNVVTATLGNLAVGSSGTKLTELADKWFLGVDEPTAGYSYSAVAGTLFGSGGPTFADVYQGDLGDCTVLASVAEVAARDTSAIQNMFIYDGTNVVNGATVGVWTVRFFENGTPTYVTVDGELPAGGGLYDTPVNGVLWVALTEKAYVELNQSGWLGTLSPGSNSYQAINSGSQGTIQAALSALTGLSNSSFSMNSTTVAQAMAAGDLVVLATGNYVNSYIVADHAYAVIGYNPANSLPFTVFNPWGINGGYEYGLYKYGEFIANAAFMNQNFILGVSSLAAADLHGGFSGDVQQYQSAVWSQPAAVETTQPQTFVSTGTTDTWTQFLDATADDGLLASLGSGSDIGDACSIACSNVR